MQESSGILHHPVAVALIRDVSEGLPLGDLTLGDEERIHLRLKLENALLQRDRPFWLRGII